MSHALEASAGAARPAGVPAWRYRLALALVLLWIAASAWLLWQAGVRDRRVFDPQARSEPAEVLAAVRQVLVAEPVPTLIAFWDAGCSCSLAAARHLEELAGRYAPRGVRVVVVPGPHTRAPQALRPLLGPDVELLAPPPVSVALPSAPAALLLDAAGRVQYYGPLADGVSCGAGSRGPVEASLDLVLRGAAQPLINRLGVACLCDWQATRS